MAKGKGGVAKRKGGLSKGGGEIANREIAFARKELGRHFSSSQVDYMLSGIPIRNQDDINSALI